MPKTNDEMVRSPESPSLEEIHCKRRKISTSVCFDFLPNRQHGLEVRGLFFAGYD
jgi:hypothetical protein